MKYDNILMNFEFEGLGPRSRSQWLFLEKNIVIALAPSFIDRFCCDFTQNLMFSMKNILIKFKFQLSSAKVNVKVAVLRNMLLAVRCFIYGLILI